MKLIQAINSRHSIMVDDEDYDFLVKFRWYIVKSRNTNYAACNKKYMHRILLNIEDSKIQVDHKNKNGLDNQKINLRACNISENQKNRVGIGASKYLGVGIQMIKTINKNGENIIYNYWLAKIRSHRSQKQIHLGCFKNEIDAAKAYDEAAKKYHGEFANLNFK